MTKLKKNHFYYGAILDAICKCNPDALPVLLSHEDSRQIYKVMTNTSQECILFFKFASPKATSKNNQEISFLFSYSDDDKEKLKTYSNDNASPVFLYLLCKQPKLENSEIIVLKYEEYKNVEDNKSITVRICKNKKYVLLFRKGSKARDNAYQIPRNRIDKTFNELADNEMLMKLPKNNKEQRKPSSLHIESLLANDMNIFEENRNCPFCDSFLENAIIHNNKNDIYSRMCLNCKRRFVNKKQYEDICKLLGKNNVTQDLFIMNFNDSKRQSGNQKESICKQVTYIQNRENKFYIMDEESDICPIHKCKMNQRIINFGMNKRDTVFLCNKCNKYIISRKHHISFRNLCQYEGKRIMQNAVFEELK